MPYLISVSNQIQFKFCIVISSAYFLSYHFYDSAQHRTAQRLLLEQLTSHYRLVEI